MTIPARGEGGGGPWLPARLHRRAVAGLCLAIVATGCATYVASNLALRTQLAAGQYDRALTQVASDRKGTDRLLVLLQRGHVLHYAGRFAESNAAFQEAEDLSDQLYSRSLSQAAVSLITNDTTVSYRGKPFELAMVPFYRAFNYHSMGQPQEAQVEARKATLGLAKAVEATVRDIDRPEDQALARRLEDNAFLHWFSGMVYESQRAANDAFIAYRNAARAYLAMRDLVGVDPPRALGRDLERVGLAVGFRDEVETLRTEAPEMFDRAPPLPQPDGGEVVVVLESGWVANRDQTMLNVPILDVDRRYSSSDDWAEALLLRSSPGWTVSSGVRVDYWLTVAVPEMATAETGRVVGLRISTPEASASSELADDLSRRAEATFRSERGRILFRSFLRALAKYGATRAARKEDDIAGAIVNLFGVLTEQADTRCWLTLPDTLRVARLRLPAGPHDLRIDYVDGAGRVVTTETVHLEVEAGGWTFLNRRPF